jgi:hypothetical protein
MCIRVNLQNNAVDSQENRNCIVRQQHNAAQGIQTKRNEISQMPGEHSYLSQSEYGLFTAVLSTSRSQRPGAFRPALSQLNSAHTILPYLFETNFNVMLFSIPRSTMWKFTSQFNDQNWMAVWFYIFTHIPDVCCIPFHPTLPLHITI